MRMQSRFFGYEIGDSAGSVLLALVIEMAAAVAVLFPFFIGPPPLENKRSESRSDRRPDREGLRPQSDGLGGSASEGAGGQTVNREIEVNDQIHADRAAFPHLNKVLSSYEMAFRDSERADPVTDGQLEDLISQIGLHNPHARAVANDIMRIIAHYKGVGIGKGRVLNLLASPAMSDVILIEHKGETKQYIYRDRTYVQNTQQRVGGLPNSASVGH